METVEAEAVASSPLAVSEVSFFLFMDIANNYHTKYTKLSKHTILQAMNKMQQ